MAKKKKVILIPYPAQGHVNPMIKLASLLSILGFTPVIVTPEFIHRRIINSETKDSGGGIQFASIPDGLDEESPRDFFAIEAAMERNMAAPLESLLAEMTMTNVGPGEEDGGVAFLVVDLLASWAIDVGKRAGVAVAGFWPAMHATYRLIAAIPDLIGAGHIYENGCPRNSSAPISLSPNEPTLTTSDLPWLIGSQTARTSRFKFWKRTLNRSQTLPFLLINTFPRESELELEPELESESEFESLFPPNPAVFNSGWQQVLEIAPLIMQTPTIFNPSFLQEDATCLEWLDERAPGSVVYVSFGSWVSPIGEAKIRSLALALETSRRPFLWVLGAAWRLGLPEGYLERVGATSGRVVSWAPQVEVLRHRAVGCYLTHCGWNSTLEAVQAKKPLLCCPIAGDQGLNCAYIVTAWRIGARMGGFGFEEVEGGIREVLEDGEMKVRIEEMNERVYGKEGRSNAMASFMKFMQDQM